MGHPSGAKIVRKKFLRQHLIIFTVYRRPYYFIADFYCAEAKLVIETDGSIHNTSLEYDQQRTEILKSKGLHVLRISNVELLDLEKVINKITAYLAKMKN